MKLFGLSISRVSAENGQRREETRHESAPSRCAGFEAATTTLWSWREMFKYLDGQLPENDLGWALSEALMWEVRRWQGLADASIWPEPDAKLETRDDHHWSRVNACAERVDDPVIGALLTFGTYRALSDILPHLLLRQQDPIRLRWNTADYCRRAGGPDLYVINDQWTLELVQRLELTGCAPAALVAAARSIREGKSHLKLG